ncbi:MAG: hypothetical protein ACRC1P_00965 [Cellulosilyticaceae bacterium]
MVGLEVGLIVVFEGSLGLEVLKLPEFTLLEVELVFALGASSTLGLLKLPEFTLLEVFVFPLEGLVVLVVDLGLLEKEPELTLEEDLLLEDLLLEDLLLEDLEEPDFGLACKVYT